MRIAKLQIYYHSHIFTHLELFWASVGILDTRFWTCLPGHFGRGIVAGTWSDSWITDTISIRDPDGEEIAYMTDVDVSLIGYPLSGLDGDKGDFRLLPAGSGGTLAGRPLWWRLLYV